MSKSILESIAHSNPRAYNNHMRQRVLLRLFLSFGIVAVTLFTISLRTPSKVCAAAVIPPGGGPATCAQAGGACEAFSPSVGAPCQPSEILYGGSHSSDYCSQGPGTTYVCCVPGNLTPPEVNMNAALESTGKTGTQNQDSFFYRAFIDSVTALTLNFRPGGSTQQNAMAPGGKSVAYTPGVTDLLVSATSALYSHPPASSVEYVADLLQNLQRPFGIQPAYAQGIGFSSLSPILTLWKVFRNLAYFFFVVIFIVVGFLIMFRAKIGSQAAVTVQQALPKLVVSLILVTFSYAIAGLMIDAMYLVIYLFIGIFPLQSIGGKTLAQVAFENNIFTNGAGLIFNGLIGGIAGGLSSIVSGILGYFTQGSSFLSSAAQNAVQGVGNVVFTLILIVIVLVSLFRVFFALLQAYVGIFFSVIFAPIQLLFGAIPGQNTFGAWIKGLVENLLVFPIVILLIFIAYYFTTAFGSTQPGGFSAPQLGSNQGAGGIAIYSALIPLGAILAMPEIIKISKGILKGQLGVSVEDLQKNFNRGKLGRQIGVGAVGAAAGLGTGAAVGGLIGLRRASKIEGGMSSEQGRKVFRQSLGVGAGAGVLGGGAVAANGLGIARGLWQETTRMVPKVVLGNRLRNLGGGKGVTPEGAKPTPSQEDLSRQQQQTQEPIKSQPNPPIL